MVQRDDGLFTHLNVTNNIVIRNKPLIDAQTGQLNSALINTDSMKADMKTLITENICTHLKKMELLLNTYKQENDALQKRVKALEQKPPAVN